MKYVFFGLFNIVKGKFRVEKLYKLGVNGWVVLSMIEYFEDVVKFVDFFVSCRGKLFGQYGIKGCDYMLDKKGNFYVKFEVLKEVENNLDEVKKCGFRGVGFYWVDYFGYIDIDNKVDFGEIEYGDNIKMKKMIFEKIVDMWYYD